MNNSSKFPVFLIPNISQQSWQKQEQERHNEIMDLLVIANRLHELATVPGTEHLVVEAAALIEWAATKLMPPADRARYMDELEKSQ